MLPVNENHFIAGAETPSPFRDFLPHRGTQLIRVGIACVLLGGLSWMPFLGGLPALVGIPVSVAAGIKMRGDVGLMRAGVMDRAGMAQAIFARQLAWLGLLLSLSRLISCVFLGWRWVVSLK